MRPKRLISIVVTIAAWGILAYAGYSIAVAVIVYGGFADRLASQSLVYADARAKLYFAPQCLQDWLSRNPAASSKSLTDMKAGEARQLRYQRLHCDDTSVGTKMLRDMGEDARNIILRPM
jgi:hypothetical protein